MFLLLVFVNKFKQKPLVFAVEWLTIPQVERKIHSLTILKCCVSQALSPLVVKSINLVVSRRMDFRSVACLIFFFRFLVAGFTLFLYFWFFRGFLLKISYFLLVINTFKVNCFVYDRYSLYTQYITYKTNERATVIFSSQFRGQVSHLIKTIFDL